MNVVGCSTRKSLRSPSPPRKRPGPFGVLDEREPGDLHRVVQLRLLDRRVLRVLAVGLHRVGAVARVPAAVASRERLVEARVAPPGDVEGAEARLAHHPLGAGRDPLGERLAERAEHHLDEAGLGLPAPDDRRGPGAVRHRALRRAQAEQPVEAVVHGQVGVDQALERVGAGREGHRVRRVDRRTPLRVRPGRVEVETVGCDLDPDLEADGLVGVAVVVDGALGPVRPRRELRDLRAHAPLRVREQLLHRGEERLAPVAVGQRRDPPDTRRVGGDLGPEVARRLVLRADLGEDQAEDVVHDLSALDDLHRRDDHALLEHLLEGADRRGRAAADVHVVRQVGDVAEQHSVDVDRRDQADVVQVDAAWVRVVGDDRVAGPEVLRAVAADRVRHLLHHRAQVHRLRERLRDRAQLGVEEGAREVGACLDVRRVGAPLQRQHHLVGRRDERVADHLERDRVAGERLQPLLRVAARHRSCPQLRRRRLVQLAIRDDDPVDVAGALDAHLLLEHVAQDARRVALLGRPVAAAAAGAVADDVAGLERDGRLCPSRVSSPPRIRTYSATRPSCPPKAPAGPASGPVGEHRERRRPLEEEVLAQAEPAAEAARTVGVVDEREPHDAHRVVELRLLDRGVLGVLAVRLHGVGAVARVPPAVAAAERLEEADVLVRDRVDAPEARVAHHRLRSGRERRGQGGQDGAEDDVDEARLRLPAADDRRRPGAVRDAALRRVEMNDPVEAVVHRQVRVDQALERVRAGGEGLRVRRVDRRAPLWIAARQVEEDAVGRDLDPRPEPHGLVGVAVGVDRALGLVDAERQRGELGPRAPLRVVEQLRHRGHDRGVAVARDERLEPAGPGRVRRDLGAEVTRSLVLRPDLREDQLEDVVDDPPGLDDLDRRDDHALLEHLAEGADRGRRAAADVDVVGEIRDVAEQLSVGEDRRDQADVVQVDAARERVVRDDHVAGPEVLGAVAPHRVRHLLDHRAEVHGLREALRDGPQLRVEEGAREVRARLDVRRVGAPAQRQHHLVRRRDERVADHLERDGIEPGRGFSLSSGFPPVRLSRNPGRG